jgi:hypothetical protein
MPSKLLTLVTGPELICFLVAVICLLKDKSKVWRSMILYLFITCLAEVGGLYIRRVLHQPNGWVYDIYTIFELGFPSLMFLHLLGKYRDSKPLILTGLTVTMIVYIAELSGYALFRDNAFTFTVLSVCYVVYSFYYYYLVIKDEAYINLKYSAAFWWITGALFYYFGSTVNNLFFKIIYEQVHANKEAPSKVLSYNISAALNMAMYICWGYSFICKKWLAK